MDFRDIDGIVNELLEQCEFDHSSLNELEASAEQFMQRVCLEILRRFLEKCEESDPDPITKCRHCGKDANYVFKRVGVTRTRLGLVRYRRAYYVCPHCYQSTCPLDERLNPYESLSRLRTLIADGMSLPVDELARAWGLGTLKGITNSHIAGEQIPFDPRLIRSDPDGNLRSIALLISS